MCLPAQGLGGSVPHPARGLMSLCAYHMLAHARAHAARSACMRMHMRSPLHPSAGLSTCLEVCADLPARAPPMHDGHQADTRGGRSSWVPHTCTHSEEAQRHRARSRRICGRCESRKAHPWEGSLRAAAPSVASLSVRPRCPRRVAAAAAAAVRLQLWAQLSCS